MQHFLFEKENLSEVTCFMCGKRGKSLRSHIRRIHNMTNDEYLSVYQNAKIMCDETRDKYRQSARKNAKIYGNWITQARIRKDDDLTIRLKNLGESVRSSIMSNPVEQRRRSELAKKTIVKWAKSNDGRNVARETAKKTSARPEIIAARSMNLRKWRENNFDLFYETCTKAMHKTWHTKPEKILGEILKNFDDSFLMNQTLYDQCFTSKSHRKQIDAMSKKFKIIVEFDGIYHFKQIKKNCLLIDVQKRDAELDHVVSDRALTLIRISHDQFSYKGGGKFNDDCMKTLYDILCNPCPGIFKIGNAYRTKEETS